MIIKTHHKITLDITQIIDRHIQIHSQNCVVIYIPMEIDHKKYAVGSCNIHLDNKLSIMKIKTYPIITNISQIIDSSFNHDFSYFILK